MQKITIAVTGISGYLGRVLSPYLENNRDITRVIGIDQKPIIPDSHSNKIQFHQLDMKDPEIEALLSNVDILVHLAFELMRPPRYGKRAVEETNIAGSRAVLGAAARQGVQNIIFTSSVVAYGLHSDNPVPLTEESPLRPNKFLYYGLSKVAVEDYLDTLEAEYPEIIFTRLRPCTIVGPNADPAQMASLTSSTAALVKGYDPLYQLLHEQDMAQALDLMIRKNIPGIFNVTSDEPLKLSQIALSQPGGQVVALPHRLARFLAWFSWRTGSSVFAPEWLDLARYPLVASNGKLKQQGWQPQYTTSQAYADLLAARKNPETNA